MYLYDNHYHNIAANSNYTVSLGQLVKLSGRKCIICCRLVLHNNASQQPMSTAAAPIANTTTTTTPSVPGAKNKVQ